MTNTDTEVDTFLSDEEVALLNQARTLLGMLSKRCARRSVDADNAMGYGNVDALAHTAAHLIFETLKWIDAYRIQRLTEDQLHNRKPVVVEVQS